MATSIRNILLAYDGSPASRRALERAGDIADGNARVTVVTVVPELPAGARPGWSVDPIQAEEQTRLIEEAQAMLAKYDISANGIAATGSASDALIDVAAEIKADLIVMGTRGRGLAARMLLGSVSTGVLHHAHCDVMVVR